MAFYGPFLNPQITLNSVDLSNHVDMVTIDYTVADIDTTTFGQVAKTRVGGLQDNKLTIEFVQDFALSSVDQTLYPLIGTLVSFNIKPTNAATTSINPAYTGSVLITEYKPLDGKVGDLLKMSVTWPLSGTITRAIS